MKNNLTVRMVQDDNISVGDVLSGGMQNALSWVEYLEAYEHLSDHLKVLKTYIIDNDLLGITADQICNENHFEFSDGTKIGFTWRAWGDFMQAVVDKKEGYMAYYS